MRPPCRLGSLPALLLALPLALPLAPLSLHAQAVAVAHFRDSPAGYSQYSGIRDSMRVVIRDDAAWRAYWMAIHRPFDPPPAAPAVDFRHEMIVLASLGARPSGGFGIHIDGATADTSGVRVRVRRTVPGSGCAVPAVVTQPVDLARIPASGLPVVFDEQVDRADCSRPPALRRPEGI